MATGSMTPQDVLWLNMDTPTNLMVVDSMVTFARPADWGKITATLQERMVGRFPVFRRIPVVPPGPTARPHWEDDPKFDIENHIVRVTLPEPGGEDELKAYVSAQRSVPLSKDKPMWVVHYIDGYMGGSATMTRIHHAIADGVRLTMVVLSLCDNADGGPVAAPRQVGKTAAAAPPSGGSASGGGGARGVLGAAAAAPDLAKGAVGSAMATVTGAIGSAKELATGLVSAPQETVLGTAAKAQDTVTGAVESARGVTDLAGGLLETSMGGEVLDPARFQDFTEALGRNAAIVPKLLLADSDPGPWTGRLGEAKLLTWSDPFPLDTVRSIGKATGTTINDVLIAVLGSALRRYAVAHGQTVGEVVWFVPVNVKPLEENLTEDLGNSFALVALTMPLDIEDPVVMLAEMKARMDDIKNSYETQLTFGIQTGIAYTPETVYSFAVKFFANRGIGVLSNVPGPREPIYLAGHEVETVTGFAPCNGNQPMTVTIFSYNGNVRIGFAGDAGTTPDLDNVPDLYAQALAELAAEVLEISSQEYPLPANLM